MSLPNKSHNTLPVSGRFDAFTAPGVRDWLAQPERAQVPICVVDLTNATFVDSTALAVLISGMKQCRERGGDLWLCGLQRPVRIIFELTRLDRAFTIYEDYAAVLDALAVDSAENQPPEAEEA
jgi:anti-sigma B factor antagonist